MQALHKGAEVCIADFRGGVDFPKVWHEKRRRHSRSDQEQHGFPDLRQDGQREYAERKAKQQAEQEDRA